MRSTRDLNSTRDRPELAPARATLQAGSRVALRRAFDLFDADGSGEIDRSELRVMMGRLGLIRPGAKGAEAQIDAMLVAAVSAMHFLTASMMPSRAHEHLNATLHLLTTVNRMGPGLRQKPEDLLRRIRQTVRGPAVRRPLPSARDARRSAVVGLCGMALAAG